MPLRSARRFVQKQLVDTVNDLLRVHLKAKHALKSDDVIHNMAEKIENSTISAEQWMDVVQYMYNGDDAMALNVMLKDAAKRWGGARLKEIEGRESARGSERRVGGSGGGASPGDKMPFASFMKVLLDFQLLGHDKFLLKFREKFGEADKDGDGIVSEQEFRSLCAVIGKVRVKGATGGKGVVRGEQEMAALLKKADPWNLQKITFSECVAVLSGDIIEMMTDIHERAMRVKEINEKRGQRGMGRL